MRDHKLILVLFASSFVCNLALAQAPQLQIDRTTGLSRIKLNGQTNSDYSLSANDPSSTNWDFLATLTLTNSSQSWFDSASALMPRRFYRAELLDGSVPAHADDFRLIDHQGNSRSLYYHQNDVNVKGFALIFTGNGCTKVQQMVSTLKSLRDQFTPQGIVFWLIDANAADNRSNIVAEASSLGLNLPILHDRAQLVARAYHASGTPEAVCVDKLGWRIFYRGAIDDRLGAVTNSLTQYYLKNALTDFLANRTVTPRQTQTNGCAITLTPVPTPSYSTDIAPLLLNKCYACHNVGSIAPFAMTNYSIVQFQALQIKAEILAGRMPPWHADPHFNTFANDASLSPAEAATLVTWIDAGAPRGAGPDPLASAPPATNYPFAWPSSLGTPSTIIAIANQSIPATGTVDYRYVNYTYTGPTVWLRAAVLLPGTVPVVHHILAYHKGVDNTLFSFLTGYAPGTGIGAFPPGTGKLLTNNTALQFQLHYIAIGQATNDTSYLGLYTMPAPPAAALIQASAPNTSFSIPANTSDHEATTASFVLSGTKAAYLYELSPHLHARGSRFLYEAIYPAGSNPATEVLLSVPYYVFHWQTSYRFAQPKYLPAGTSIRCTCAWDNSTQNQELMELFYDQDNPNHAQYDPNNAVGWGDQTWNEMFIGYFNYSLVP
jgi:hypothetical protein